MTKWRANCGVVAGATVFWTTAEEPSQTGVEKPGSEGRQPHNATISRGGGGRHPVNNLLFVK